MQEFCISFIQHSIFQIMKARIFNKNIKIPQMHLPVKQYFVLLVLVNFILYKSMKNIFTAMNCWTNQ